MDASVAAWQGGDLATYLEVARLAATVVPPAEDVAAVEIARSFAGYVAMIAGDTSEGVRLLRDVVAWGATAREPLHALWASFGAFWLGDGARAGALIDRAGALARERGELGTLAESLGIGAVRLAFDQRFDEASVAASEAVRLARGARRRSRAAAERGARDGLGSLGFATVRCNARKLSASAQPSHQGFHGRPAEAMSSAGDFTDASRRVLRPA